MAQRTRVLGDASGPLRSDVLFVGEAPGRLGADRTGEPFVGDQAGRNFAELLTLAGIKRSEVFVTNAVLCNPQNALGNNDRPTGREIQNCEVHLRRLIAILDPNLVVTLGATALAAAALIEPHDLILRRDVARPHTWHGRTLVPMYHPGARARIHRPAAQQQRDFAVLARLLSD